MRDGRSSGPVTGGSQDVRLPFDLCAEQVARDVEVGSADRRDRLRTPQRCIVEPPRSGRGVNPTISAEHDERCARIAKPFHRTRRHHTGRLAHDHEAPQPRRCFGVASRSTQNADAVGDDKVPAVDANGNPAAPQNKGAFANAQRLVQRREVWIGCGHVLEKCGETYSPSREAKACGAKDLLSANFGARLQRALSYPLPRGFLTIAMSGASPTIFAVSEKASQGRRETRGWYAW